MKTVIYFTVKRLNHPERDFTMTSSNKTPPSLDIDSVMKDGNRHCFPPSANVN